MKLSSLPRKIKRGLPYLGKELRAIVSDHTPIFIGKPRTVHIWRGAPCNARCIMCDYGFLKGEALRAISRSEFTDDMMPRALNEIAELCGRGTLVSYMGGEPTVNRCVMDWVEQAGKLGLDFRFTTNGYTMTEEMARRFVAAGLFNIGVSLESLDPKINEIIRPHPNGTLKTIRAIELMLQERQRQKKFVSINVKTVLTDVNLESFIEIIKRWGKVDGMMCTPQAFEPMGQMPPETKELLYIKDITRLQRVVDQIRELKRDGYAVHVSDQGLDEMLKLYSDDKNKNSTMHGAKMEMDPSEPACNIGTDNMWIEHGMVKLCPYHPPIGNFMTETNRTIKQMWESEMTRQIREQTRACRRLCTISCLRRTPLTHKVSTFLKIA
jgi:sulfatase maturation enzyme AslB (radical SAM superfamily)